ncbi:phytanoyl-CoA dioxygenase family protein [Paenibacillus mendelii]|uniref:Phytanoyl-CoA dioxygenase family protein n=1 Tax=Paenibacillus mendelii TaxID=206163 RepID=A0ABV6JKZ3_9BACL|nr:phytanoyl-CoA dioxygenase family protein [Paenibacillus mendelii]MCQ6559111.1 phytanoyl-CoA dioxygenase family protein [Paenibacillus mendelii]
MITLGTAEREHYYEQGFFIVRQLYNEEQMETIKQGIQRIIDRAKSGEGSDVPWINKEKGIVNRIGSMLSPGYFQKELADSLEHSPIIEIIESILEQPIRYSLFGMLASGDGQGYVQNWHRDLVPLNSPSEVTDLLRDARDLCQMNAALFDDRYLTIVPGSHLRKLTDEQNEALRLNPSGSVPGELVVELGAGDAVFYYPNILHRGYNPDGHFRWSLHHAFRTADSPHREYEGQRDWISGVEMERFGPRVRALLERFSKSMVLN